MLSRSVPAVVAALFALTACGAPADQAQAPATTASAAECTPEAMQTLSPGTLTIATDDPAYEPWFVDNAPENGKGYESAVGYAIGEKLGYPKDKITWKRVPFNAVVQPGDHQFDLDLNQVSITEERKNAVDFSSSYYDVKQAVVTREGSPVASVTSIADLKDAKLGAQVGTTSYTAITEQIQASRQPLVFDTNDAAVQALKNGQVDAVVVDLPTAFYMIGAQLDDGVILGQIEPEGQPEQLGAVLPKNSPITACVTGAVDALRADGTLEKLENEWLTAKGAPVLTAN